MRDTAIPLKGWYVNRGARLPERNLHQSRSSYCPLFIKSVSKKDSEEDDNLNLATTSKDGFSVIDNLNFSVLLNQDPPTKIEDHFHPVHSDTDGKRVWFATTSANHLVNVVVQVSAETPVPVKLGHSFLAM